MTSITALRILFRQNRYLKLNLEAFGRYGTVEFRQHSGTLNGEKAEAWIGLLVALVNSAKRGRSCGLLPSGQVDRATSFAHMLKRVPEKYRAALIARREALASRFGAVEEV